MLASGSVQLPRFTLLESGSLLISPTRLSDAGTYTCLATNSRGVDEASADLVVWGECACRAPCPQDPTLAQRGRRQPPARDALWGDGGGSPRKGQRTPDPRRPPPAPCLLSHWPAQRPAPACPCPSLPTCARPAPPPPTAPALFLGCGSDPVSLRHFLTRPGEGASEALP